MSEDPIVALKGQVEALEGQRAMLIANVERMKAERDQHRAEATRLRDAIKEIADHPATDAEEIRGMARQTLAHHAGERCRAQEYKPGDAVEVSKPQAIAAPPYTWLPGKVVEVGSYDALACTWEYLVATADGDVWGTESTIRPLVQSRAGEGSSDGD